MNEKTEYYRSRKHAWIDEYVTSDIFGKNRVVTGQISCMFPY